MSVSRFYSLALGKFKNFTARTDGLISEGDTTPDVALNSLLYANNSSTIIVTDFDNGEEGQIIHLINLGSALTLARGTELLTTDSSNLNINDSVTFVQHNTSWYELSRSKTGALNIRYAPELPATSAPDVTNARVLVINNSGATTLTNLSGGYVGQVLTVVCVKSNVTLSHNALLLNADTGGVGFILTVSGAVSLINITGSKWVAERYAFTP